MGTLPPNMTSLPELQAFPAGRFCQLIRENTLPDVGSGVGLTAPPPDASAPWYATTPVTIWDDFQTDYGGQFSTAGSGRGSTPHLTGTPGSDMYYITISADSRPVPFLAWFDIFCWLGVAGGPGTFRNRFGLVQRSRSENLNPSFYKVLASSEYHGAWVQSGYRSFSAVGMGVVPAYRSHEVFVGWDNGDDVGVSMYAAEAEELDWGTRNFFGVLTF